MRYLGWGLLSVIQKYKQMKLQTRASLVLIVVTMIWGATFPLIHAVIHSMNPILFVFLRMLLASVAFLPFILRQVRRTDSTLLWGGWVLALLNTCTYICQTEGLQTITASRSAFVTGLYVVMVPLIAPLFGFGWAKKREFMALLLCLLGIYILTGANLTALTRGDFWTMACALLYALTILTLQCISMKTKENGLLSFYTVAFGVLAPIPFLPTQGWAILASWKVIGVLLFCALLATSLMTYLMTRYQKHVGVIKAPLIYALEPVFASIFSVLMAGEHMTWFIFMGGSLIVISLMLPSITAILVQRN